jgi:RNA polymerase sigma factor (sigma-70 family)
MPKTASGVLLQQIQRLIGQAGPEPGTDRDLLRRYTVHRDEAAFTLLVQRHGRMVWNVCRRALANYQDAEDAFQATFIVLARKAAAVRWQPSIASWLYAVAQRVACKARSEAARRPASTDVEPVSPNPFEAMSAQDLLATLDAEVAALPERYRGPLVLCWLEGRTQEEAARLLGSSLSTLRRRLETARRLLHTRLTRRGVAAAVALSALALAPSAAPAVPVMALSGTATNATVSARAAALAESLTNATPAKVKALLALAGICLVVAGVALAARLPRARSLQNAEKKEVPVAQDAGKKPEPLDALGDPLPPGALLRLGSVRLRHGVTLFAVAYSPVSDMLASGGWDGTILLWDPATGKELRSIRGPEKGVYTLAFSPDGKRLVGGGVDGVVYVWDVAMGKEVGRLEALPGEVHALAFSPKGDMLAAGAKTTVRLWDANWKALKTFEVEEGTITSVAFAPDGRTLAAAVEDKAVYLWETGDGKLVRQLSGHKGRVATVVFSNDGKSLITAGPDETRIWEAASGKKLHALGKGNNRGGCAALSPDGQLLAVGGDDGVIRLWDWTAGKELRKLRRLPDHVRSLAFSRDGKNLAALGDAGAIHLWEVATGQEKLDLPGHQERLMSVAATPDGRTVVTAAWDGTVRLWDAKTGKEVRRFEIPPLTEDKPYRVVDPTTVRRVVVSQDGKLLAAVRGDEFVVIWELATSKEVYRFHAGSVAFSPDGKLIACGEHGQQKADASTGIICLYDRGTGKKLRELRGHLTPIASMSFTPDSKTLLSRGVVYFGARFGDPGEDETKFIRLWDVATGKERKAPSPADRPNEVVLSSDGRTVANTGMLGKAIMLWETVTGGQRGELVGHTEMLFDLAWSPDGRTLASASMDGTVRLWDPFAGKELGRLEGHRGWVLAVAFAPDGKTLISGSIDTTALVWDVSRFTQRDRSAVFTGDQMKACWDDLGRDAEIAYRAVGRLLSSPGPALALLRKHMKPAPAADDKRIAQLIAGLQSKEFKVRDEATKELERLGEIAAPALQKSVTDKASLELKRRVEALLEKLEGATLPPETLQQVRAVEVLEGIGTPEARELLQSLVAGGAPQARLTREAKAALQRVRE